MAYIKSAFFWNRICLFPNGFTFQTEKGRTSMNTKKYTFALLLVVALSLMFGDPLADADDTEIYALGELPANVLIVLDNSGSMCGEDSEHDYDSSKTYTPWAGMPDKGSNYNNWYWYNRTRWQVAKNVVTNLLDQTRTSGIRFGLMRMDGNNCDGSEGFGDWGIPVPGDLPYEYNTSNNGLKRGPPPLRSSTFPMGISGTAGSFSSPLERATRI